MRRELAMLSVCLLPLGCASVVSPQQIRDLGVVIDKLDSEIDDGLQIMIYAARQQPNVPLANELLDGVLRVIGEPSPMECTYAVAMDEQEARDLIRHTTTLAIQRQSMRESMEKKTLRLYSDYYHYRDSHTKLNWLLFTGALFLIALIFLRR